MKISIARPNSLSASFFKVSTATLCSIGYFLSQSNITADETSKSEKANTQTVRNLSTEEVLELRDLIKKGTEGEITKRKVELLWNKTSWHFTKAFLLSLYRQEKVDSYLLKQGKIKDSERKVKISYADFVGKNESASDGGESLMLHVIKYFENNNGERIYVNEHWPVDPEKGNVLYTKAIRVRIPKDNLDITDMINVVWAENIGSAYDIDSNGKRSPISIYPKLSRPSIWSGNKNNNKEESLNKRVMLSSPLSCISCHNDKSTNHDRTITPDNDFGDNKPYTKQNGFLKYKTFLERLVSEEKITQRDADKRLKDLQDSTSMENPGIIPALTDTDIEWEPEDKKADRYFYAFPRLHSYKHEKANYIESSFDMNREVSHDWWNPDSAIAIPK